MTRDLQIRFETTRLTPKLAQQLLNNNHPSNRALNRATVENYKADILAGRWGMTHQPIGIDVKGYMLDGQHRCQAVVESGVAIIVPIAHNVPERAMEVVDQGRARSVMDMQRITGLTDFNYLQLATARMIDHNGKPPTTANTNQQKIETASAHAGVLDFIFTGLGRRVPGVTIAPVLAAVGVAFYAGVAHPHLKHFLGVLVSGMVEGPKDKIIVALRDQLLQSNARGNDAGRYDVYLRAQRVIRAVELGERHTRIYTPDQPIYTRETAKH